MFIAALYVITKNWKQLKCPTGVEWLNKLVHPCHGILLRIKKKPTVDTRSNFDESQGHYAEFKKRKKKKQHQQFSYHVILFV